MSACGHVNAAGPRFCTECGTPLSAGCAGCGAELLPGQRFCGECGRPAAAAVSKTAVAESERKQVTVLFADVVRSMELAERLDADEWTSIMARLFALCTEVVERFGGTVDKFTGDGAMALFGAPVAQEDHARRACHAALGLVAAAREYAAELRAARGLELAVRVGLNSGEVVAGAVGRAGYTAVGHTVGLAQRMEALATPGGVCLSEHTAELVAGYFRASSQGLVEVKGSTQPVEVFTLEAAVARPSVTRAGSGRMVGRAAELALLEAALADAMDGRAQVVGVVGEAGAGKSRLCDELARRAAAVGVTVRRTAGVSHARTVPLLPVLGLLRDLFTVTDGDSAEQVREKVASRLLGLDPAFEPDLGLIFDFMEVPDPERPTPQLGPEVRRRRVLDVLRRVTQRRSEGATVLLLLEDLHWFDQHSIDFLTAWFPTFPGTRTLLVTNFRPEFHATWMGHSYYRQLPVAPLNALAVQTLLEELLGADPSLVDLTAAVLARSGGNPFFVEEIVRAMAADGTLAGTRGSHRLTRLGAEVRVPPTVQAVLAGRIDRLGAREKAVLQAAAVIGRTFTESVLAAVVELSPGEVAEAVSALCGAEMLQEKGIAGEYRFWHPLTQEVAYGSLRVETRRRHHRAVATALLASTPGRHDELASLVATHYEAADCHLEASRWQVRAAGKAVRRDFRDAQLLLRSALSHLTECQESDETLALGVHARTALLRLGARAGMDTAEVDRLFGEARAAAERLGNPALLTMLWVADGAVRVFTGDIAGGCSSQAESRRHADRTGDRHLQAFAWGVSTWGLMQHGPVPAGLAAVERALALCGDDPRTSMEIAGLSAFDLTHFGQAALLLAGGRLAEAHQVARDALAGFEQRPNAEHCSMTLALVAQLPDWTGEWADGPAAAEAAAAATRMARDAGSIAAAVRSLQATGVVALRSGAAAAAAATFTEALAEARKFRSGLLDEPALLAHLARAHLALGDAEAARASADEAVAVARRQGAAVVEVLTHLVRGRVLRETAVAPVDLAEARAALDAGEALVLTTGATTHVPFLAEERARLDDDRAALEASAAAYDAIGATGHARRLRAELAG